MGEGLRWREKIVPRGGTSMSKRRQSKEESGAWSTAYRKGECRRGEESMQRPEETAP